MYKCPNRDDYKDYYGDVDEKMGKWVFHFANCTCPIMDLYLYKMVNQDDHIRAYWEDRGELEVSWSDTYGMLLHYPKDLKKIIEIGYPY